jgi:hypothetical protein
MIAELSACLNRIFCRLVDRSMRVGLGLVPLKLNAPHSCSPQKQICRLYWQTTYLIRGI